MEDQKKWIARVARRSLREAPYLGLNADEINSFFESRISVDLHPNALLPEDCGSAAQLEQEIYFDRPEQIKGYEKILCLASACFIVAAVRKGPYLCFKASRNGKLSAYVIALYGTAEHTRGRFFNEMLSREFGRLDCVYVSDWQARTRWGGGSVARAFFQSYGTLISKVEKDIPILAHARLATSFTTVVQNTARLTSFAKQGMRYPDDLASLHVHSTSDITPAGEAFRGIVISAKKIGPV